MWRNKYIRFIRVVLEFAEDGDGDGDGVVDGLTRLEFIAEGAGDGCVVVVVVEVGCNKEEE